MLIQGNLATGDNPYTPLLVNNQGSSAALSYAISAAEVDIPRVTLSRAVLDKQPGGALRWMFFN
ncbi:MAG: hypothetical protein K940chlam7_01720, partial [Chlamydiae bacterium]|nr:hypothetical protein [Chlamydiota bacterium]